VGVFRPVSPSLSCDVRTIKIFIAISFRCQTALDDRPALCAGLGIR
jgi:hypothetical protein